MLMILMCLDSVLVEKWVRYAELNFWCAICFWSIRAYYWELDQINVRSVLYVERSFDPYMPCLILEKLLMLLCRTQRRRRWKPLCSAVHEQYQWLLVKRPRVHCLNACNQRVLCSNSCQASFSFPLLISPCQTQRFNLKRAWTTVTLVRSSACVLWNFNWFFIAKRTWNHTCLGSILAEGILMIFHFSTFISIDFQYYFILFINWKIS